MPDEDYLVLVGLPALGFQLHVVVPVLPRGGRGPSEHAAAALLLLLLLMFSAPGRRR